MKKYLLFGLNIEVFLIVMADLWSGVRKANKTVLQNQVMDLKELLKSYADTIT